MISFKKIRYKNFLSTGNIPIEVELDKSHTTLIVGSNGSGKSTHLELLRKTRWSILLIMVIHWLR